jgi:hypothetical protein
LTIPDITAIECYSVLEESSEDIPELKKIEIINLLEKSKKNSPVEKNSLAEAIISFLK